MAKVLAFTDKYGGVNPESYWIVGAIRMDYLNKTVSFVMTGFKDAACFKAGKHPVEVVEFVVGPKQFDIYFAKDKNPVDGCYRFVNEDDGAKLIGVPPVEEEETLLSGEKRKKLVQQPNVSMFANATDA